MRDDLAIAGISIANDCYSLTRPVYIFFGGMVQIFGAVGEWILGNTFPCALFFTYGAFLSNLLEDDEY